jgi:polyisoprenoid-binding protein YceI
VHPSEQDSTKSRAKDEGTAWSHQILEVDMIAAHRRNLVCVSTILLTAMLGNAQASSGEIDVQKSTLTVRVFKTGLFSALGHEHEISAPIQKGSLDETNRSVELSVDARQMRVVDKDVSEKDRAQVQETMLGPKVLDICQFPEIHFRSRGIESAGPGRFTVTGELALHGQTRAVKFEVQKQDGHFKGSAQLKQSDFGIRPINVGGGTVKVKDELRVEFDIVPKA